MLTRGWLWGTRGIMLVCNAGGDGTCGSLAVCDADATVGGDSNHGLVVIASSEVTVLCLWYPAAYGHTAQISVRDGELSEELSCSVKC